MEHKSKEKGSWRFRAYCCSSHIARRYGLIVIDEIHGGNAVHYGWPMRSVGFEFSWRRNTWFAGLELWQSAKSKIVNDIA